MPAVPWNIEERKEKKKKYQKRKSIGKLLKLLILELILNIEKIKS